MDPEPGRCRRTDGKKWRCSKDAYPDSKYCERHMHRGRNRSRKPVESQTMTQSSSTVTSLIVTGSSGGTGSFQSLPLNALGNTQGTDAGAATPSHYQIDSIPYGIPNKDYRYGIFLIFMQFIYAATFLPRRCLLRNEGYMTSKCKHVMNQVENFHCLETSQIGNIGVISEI